MLAYYRRPACS